MCGAEIVSVDSVGVTGSTNQILGLESWTRSLGSRFRTDNINHLAD